MQNKIDVNFFPGWTRKSVTFTIDDGNVKLDKKFLDIVKPGGFVGAFNLVSSITSSLTPEGYRELYRGNEIANHCKYHPALIHDLNDYTLSDDEFDSKSANPELIYKGEEEGLYRICRKGWWNHIATKDTYKKLVDDGKRELEEIFGEGSIKAFVWPYGFQRSEELLLLIAEEGYLYIRRTGDLADADNFDLVKDRMSWSYTAHNFTMLPLMEKYEAAEDDGKLKCFSFGVHSHDFENAGNWDVLEEFVRKYGNRPDDFWYATPSEIFEYEDATRALMIDGNGITNPTDKTVYIKVDGEKKTLKPGESIAL